MNGSSTKHRAELRADASVPETITTVEVLDAFAEAMVCIGAFRAALRTAAYPFKEPAGTAATMRYLEAISEALQAGHQRREAGLAAHRKELAANA
jgi:hypothetical protein